MRILVIEDEKKVANFLRQGLEEEHYAVDVAYDGEQGEELASSQPFDLVILDLLLPKKDGIAVLRSLRERRVNVPVLVLTAKSSTDDKVVGLDSGADDYLTKPFGVEELFARIRVALRHTLATRTATPTVVASDTNASASGRSAIASPARTTTTLRPCTCLASASVSAPIARLTCRSSSRDVNAIGRVVKT